MSFFPSMFATSAAAGGVFDPASFNGSAVTDVRAPVWDAGRSNIPTIKISMWVTVVALTSQYLMEGGTGFGNVRVELRSNGNLRLSLGATNSTSTEVIGAGFHHFFIDYDNSRTSERAIMYVDGVKLTVPNAASSTYDPDSGELGFYTRASGSPALASARTTEVWLDEDAGDLAQLSDFYDNGAFVDLGADGSKPTGSQPEVYFSGIQTLADWNNAVNLGTVSGFVTTGTFTAIPPIINLVTNGDFSNGTTGWSGNGTSILTVVSEQMTVDRNSGSFANQGFQDITTVASQTYNLDVDLIAESGNCIVVIAGNQTEIELGSTTIGFTASSTTTRISFNASPSSTGTVTIANVVVATV